MIDVINDALDTTVQHIPLAALTWDPTYGQLETKSTGVLSVEAAQAMDAVFRR
jgi:hypothetical protein